MTTPRTAGDTPAVLNRLPELVVALLLLAVGALVVVDSLRVGAGWGDDGPKSGYFPFYIGAFLIASSGWIVLRQLLQWRSDRSEFAERSQVVQVLAIFAPMVVYIGLIYPLGIYVASALLIAYFMVRYGRYRWHLTLPVALGVPLVFFLVFERWFLVPLPKGPLERMLGF